MKKHPKTARADLSFRYFELQRLRTVVDEAEKRRTIDQCGPLMNGPAEARYQYEVQELSDLGCPQPKPEVVHDS